MRLTDKIAAVLCISFVLTFFTESVWAAAPCQPASSKDLRALIKEHSPFYGRWRMTYKGKKYSGPINLRSRGGDTSILRVQSSGASSKLNQPGIVEVQYTSKNRLTFHKNGRYRLKLTSNCRLVGTQAHRTGTVSISLSPQ